MIRFVLVASTCAALAGAVAVGSDHARWSALLLHAEPVLLTALAVGAYAAWTARFRVMAGGLLVGGVIGFGLVRLPAQAAGPMRAAPAWAARVQSCAAAIDPPTAPVGLLQWTLGSDVDEDAILRAVEVIEPDVVVLFNLPDSAVLVAVEDRLGGEYAFLPPTATSAGLGIYTRGEFSLCDGVDEWVDGLDGPGGIHVGFVGLGRTATFPLVVTRFPAPWSAGDWSAEMADSGERLSALLDTLRSPLTVVMADAPVTGTYRHLFGELAALGVRPVATPPNFPARFAGLPLLPLHAYDRMWIGGGWVPLTSRRVRMDSGIRTPVWTQLDPLESRSAWLP